MMKNSPLVRGLALLLCAQPFLWMSGVALAQSMDDLRMQQRQETPRAESVQPEAPGREAPNTEFNQGQVPGLEAPSVEHLRATPSVSPIAPIDEPVEPDRYRLAHGDVLELNFWGLRNFTFRVTLDVEGRAFVPKVGYFDLQGKTLTQARRAMREAIARYYRLDFGVTLAEPRTFLVQVAGAVARPGSYPARATERVASVIAKAGGFNRNGSRRRIEIVRHDGARLASDLLMYEITGNVEHNPYLLDGDIVRIPYQDTVATIDGAVNRPGRYELIRTRDSAELLELGGGLAPNATTVLPIRVVRQTAQGKSEQREFAFTQGGNAPQFAVQNEDTVTVPRYSELERMITVVGAITGATVARAAGPVAAGAAATSASAAITPEEATATRRVPYVDGDTVRTLLDRIGGVGPLADLKGSYIAREGKAIPIDLYTLLMLRDLSADRRVELGDTVVIPFRRTNILVEGAVFAPGSYPFNPDFKIEQYLSIAGGRNRFAQDVDAVRLVTPRGETKEYTPDLVVEPGSSIVVPERNFSRSEIVQIIISAAGILLSGVAVVIAARK